MLLKIHQYNGAIGQIGSHKSESALKMARAKKIRAMLKDVCTWARLKSGK